MTSARRGIGDPMSCGRARTMVAELLRAIELSRSGTDLSSKEMPRVASVLVALLVAFSPILGETCVLRCHHDVACHRASSQPPAAPCHQSASAPSATLVPTNTCDALPFSAPALRPGDAGGASVRAPAAPATIVATVPGSAVSVSSFEVVPPGHATRASRVTPTPLRL
jgi:hypothetical protein